MASDGWSGLIARTERDLEDWTPSNNDLEQIRAEGLRLLALDGSRLFRKQDSSCHFTASCFVFSASLDQVVLALHRKAGRWLQLGGHIEAEDASASCAAIREAREESGLTQIDLAFSHPLDLDRHDLRGSFGGCQTHWDLGYVAIADPEEPMSVSSESDDVRWWRVSDIATEDSDLAARVSLILWEMQG
jgi:8-oxo-dGTP pyrophosphatase MutT (NUDIX family)